MVTLSLHYFRLYLPEIALIDTTNVRSTFQRRGGVYHRGNVTESDVDFLIKAYQDISVPIKFIGAVSTGDYIDSER